MLSKSHDIFKPENHARRATMTSKDREECFCGATNRQPGFRSEDSWSTQPTTAIS